MKFDTRLTVSVVLLAGLSVLFPFAADWHVPLLGGVVVAWIENGQALWLLFGAVFTVWYIRPLSRPEGEKQFWLWAALWWVVLLGRSTSWGRAYFPQAPHLVFRIISVILIGALLLSLFSRHLRREIMRRVKEQSIPFWLLAVTVGTFLISDTVEHHRLLAPLFVRDLHYADMMEELYEIPFMLGLLLTTHYFMRADKIAEMKLTVAYQ
ncbi:TPA: hypothetical protein PFE14_002644 [Kluyvera ascorbata]|nr:hypothetical protein [Kluyvera ascorbata]